MIKRTLGSLEFKKIYAGQTDVWLMSDIEPHVAIRLKSIFPKIRKEQTNHFVFKNEGNNCFDLDWFCDRYPLKITDNDLKLLRSGRKGYESMLQEIEQILLPDYRPREYTGLKPGKKVRTYQVQAVEILMLRKSLLLGDDMGLGKTFSAMAAMIQPGTLPAAVVVKTHLPIQWNDAIADFIGYKVHIINSTTPYELPAADIYLFKYSQLSGWSDIFATGFFKMACFDEIQELRTGEESAKGRGAYTLADNVEYKLGLSATPVHNFGIEIWNILRAINPDVLGNKKDFLREWGGEDGKSIKDPVALGTFLREQQVMLRRTKEDVGQKMPPINRIVETVATDQKAMDSIRDLARQLAIKTVSGSFMERGQAARELDLLARLTTGVAKARAVAAYVRIFLENNVPVLLGGWHREVYSIWLEELADFNPVMFTGSESASQKNKSKVAFMEGKTNLMIMSLRSGDGLNGLQYRCSTVIYGELDWSPKIHDQMTGRLYREHQLNPVTAIYLNSSDGSDPPMIDLLGRKSAQSRGIIDPNSPFEKVHSDSTRVRELARQFLDKERADALKDSTETFAILPETELEPS